MDFDDILRQYLGEFGLFQLLFILLAGSAGIQTAISVMEYPFIGASPAHSCHVDELNQYNFSDSEIERFVSPPTDDGYDSCTIYSRDYSNVTEADIETFLSSNQSEALSTAACTEWRYDDSTFSSTFVTQWDLVCGRQWMVAASQSAYMVGQFFVFIGGFFSDRYGRRTAVLVFMMVRVVGRLVTILAPNVYVFTAGRFLLGVSGTIFYSCVYVIGLELVGPRWRALAGAAPYYWFLAGCQVTVGLAYWLRDWRPLLVAGTALVIPYLAFFCWLPESPRWLAARGRKKQSRDVMERMARVNKRTLPDTVFISIKADGDEAGSSVRDVMELFRSWHFIKVTLIFILQWNAITLVYYGLTFYLPSIGGNPYFSAMLGGLIEVPAAVYSQLTMNTWLGRRINLTVCFLLSGFVLLSVLLIPTDNSWLLLTLAVLGKWGVSANWNIIYMITSEVYPTRLRSAGLTLCSMSGRIGGAISPFIAQLAGVYSGLPALVMGILAVTAGLLALLLPETRGQHLKDTVEHSHTDRWKQDEELSLKQAAQNS